MPSKGQAVTLTYQAWNTSTQAYVTGDVANHTLRLIKDGTEAAPTNSPAEIDATNAPGRYSLLLTTAEASFNLVTLTGKSSTSNVILIDISCSFENLPTAVPNAANGLLTFGTGAGQINVDGAGNASANVQKWLGTTVLALGAAGSIPITDATTGILFANATRTGTAQAGTVNSITLDAGASSTTDAYLNNTVFIDNGTGAFQAATISAYNGTTKVATFVSQVTTAPVNGSKFAIVPFGQVAATVVGNVTVATILSSAAQFKKGVQSPAFVFALTDDVNHQPVTGKSPIVQISKDAGALANPNQAVAEIGGGLYYIPFFTATEMNCNALGITVLKAPGFDGYGTVLYTQP